MHYPVIITDDVYWIGVNDLETAHFESLWPIPDGITYNSYLILDKKNTLVDTVKSNYLNAYLEKIKNAIPPGEKIDYLIINHMEPDHSGSVLALMNTFPEMQIVGNKKTAELLKQFYNVTERVKIINDGEALNTGNYSLRCTLTPMVHWPETMMTYLDEKKMLFSGDVFGGFGASNGGIFDDEVDLKFYEFEILRYFSNIIGKYSTMVRNAIDKLGGFDIRIVASTHGPVFRSNPGYIIDKYRRWANYEPDAGVLVLYGSMYGNTQKLAEVIARGIADKEIPVRLFNVSKKHVSFAIAECWKNRGLIIGTPTYNTKIFPLVENFLHSFDKSFLQSRVVGIFGSYSWSGGGVRNLKEIALKDSWNVIDPIVEVKSAPTNDDLLKSALLASKLISHLQ